MLQKIISDGQTGAGRGALDAAIKLDIPYAGSLPQGRRTEAGRLPDQYHLVETDQPHYFFTTERNVVEAQGTLILSHGVLSFEAEHARRMATKHERPWLHADLQQRAEFEACQTIADWLTTHNLTQLHVTGPRASQDPKIYQATLDIVETVYYLQQTLAHHTGRSMRQAGNALGLPTTVKAAVNQLIQHMALRDRALVANMSYPELATLTTTLGVYIQDNYGISGQNIPLIEDCRRLIRQSGSQANDLIGVVIESLWKELQRTHKLRIIQ